ncbi:MAG: hypothetical protein NFCOHLIN_00199 [Gammaproteobacteria bacterium]|nr:hypothetical protein [Gammaproteobacteria bacterium]
MNIRETADTYLNAWAGRDVPGLIDVFGVDGTYWDPSAGELRGSAIGEHAGALFAGFPDITLEPLAVGEIGVRTVAAHWRMCGTHEGPFRNIPPTGRKVALEGASILEIEGDHLCSARVYFDSRSIPEQLGMQVMVQPRSIGQSVFGYGVNLRTGNAARPGAFALTTMQVRSPEEFEEVRQYARRMYVDMSGMPGFIGIFAGGAGDRLFTAAAWEDTEGPRQMVHHPAHREATQRLFQAGWATSVMTSVCTPTRLSYWQRCEACNAVSDREAAGGRCRCGAGFPPVISYW